VDERQRPGCVLLPGCVAVSGWELGYQLGVRGLVLVLANWAVKVGCLLGQARMRSGSESRQLGCVIDDGACWERMG
jgi:hypothetical protein